MAFFGWEGDRRTGGKYRQPTAPGDSKSHLRADCLHTGISSGPLIVDDEYEETLPSVSIA